MMMMTTNSSGIGVFNILIAIAFFVIKTVVISAAKSCDLDRNDCVPLKECDVMNMLYIGDALPTPEIVEILEESKCKPDSTSSNVCCPKLDDTEEVPDIDVRFGEAPKACQTPYRQPGKCVSVRNCKPALQLLTKPRNQLTRQELDYLRKSQCGYESFTPFVCCASGTTPAPKQTQRPKVASSTNLLPTFDMCEARLTNRIHGGSNTKVDEFPWMALIEYSRKVTNKRGIFNCGGSLITTKFILTAAHCLLNDMVPSQLKPTSVRLGEWDTSTEKDCDQDADIPECVDQPVQNIPIGRTMVHEKYNEKKFYHHDIALIKLTRPAVINYYVSPICLPYTYQLKNLNLEREFLDVAGWGSTETGQMSSIKQKVDVPVVNNQKCRDLFKNKEIVASQLCAGGVQGKDSCRGDSGGPLMKQHSNGLKQFVFQAGIVSYGSTTCGKDGTPAIYTRVSSYMDWITTNMQRL